MGRKSRNKKLFKGFGNPKKIKVKKHIVMRPLDNSTYVHRLTPDLFEAFLQTIAFMDEICEQEKKETIAIALEVNNHSRNYIILTLESANTTNIENYVKAGVEWADSCTYVIEKPNF